MLSLSFSSVFGVVVWGSALWRASRYLSSTSRLLHCEIGEVWWLEVGLGVFISPPRAVNSIISLDARSPAPSTYAHRSPRRLHALYTPIVCTISVSSRVQRRLRTSIPCSVFLFPFINPSLELSPPLRFGLITLHVLLNQPCASRPLLSLRRSSLAHMCVFSCMSRVLSVISRTVSFFPHWSWSFHPVVYLVSHLRSFAFAFVSRLVPICATPFVLDEPVCTI